MQSIILSRDYEYTLVISEDEELLANEKKFVEEIFLHLKRRNSCKKLTLHRNTAQIQLPVFNSEFF